VKKAKVETEVKRELQGIREIKNTRKDAHRRLHHHHPDRVLDLLHHRQEVRVHLQDHGLIPER
jgi:hypothetical protein